MAAPECKRHPRRFRAYGTAWRQGRRADRHPASDNRPGTGRPLCRAISRKAAAASDDPPPMPEATGRCFSSSSASPSACASRAARSTRLSPSPDRPAASGPVTESEIPAPAVARSMSPKLREHNQRIQQVIAVCALPGHMQRKVDLGGRVFRRGHCVSVTASGGVLPSSILRKTCSTSMSGCGAKDSARRHWKRASRSRPTAQ